jgi:hypothetical protein
LTTKNVGLLLVAASGPGVLHQLTGVVARHGADITSVEILESRQAESRVYFEPWAAPKCERHPLCPGHYSRRTTPPGGSCLDSPP